MQEKGISYQLATNSTWLYRSPQGSTSYFSFIAGISSDSELAKY